MGRAKGEIVGDTKESISVSIKSSTVEALKEYVRLKGISYASTFIDDAIREKIGRDLAVDPSSWEYFRHILDDLSCHRVAKRNIFK